MNVIERIGVANAGPQNSRLIRSVPQCIVMNLIASDKIVATSEATVQPALYRYSCARDVEDFAVLHCVAVAYQIYTTPATICNGA